MRGDFIDGFVTLAGNFPPTLSKESQPEGLKPNESPDCYGVDCEKDGRLKTGSCPAGTARTAPAGTGSYTACSWYYNRLWYASGAVLHYGAPEYRSTFLRQGTGQLTADAAIVAFMPCMDNALWIATATGSHIVRNADDRLGRFDLSKFSQEAVVPVAGCALTLGGIPYLLNAGGLFAFDGSKTKEISRPVRDSLGPFYYSAAGTDGIKADYTKQYVIGYDGTATKFAVDIRPENFTDNSREQQSEKLFDYSTSGFRFQSRTIAHSRAYNPFTVSSIVFIIEHGNTSGGGISWQSRTEHGSWYDENEVVANYESGSYTRIEVPLENPLRTGHRFDVRLTSLSSNIYIKEIQVCVAGLSVGSYSE